MISDIDVISKKLEQLGYITSLIHDNDSSILLFYRKSKNSEIIFGISQSNTLRDMSVGNIMIIYDDRPTLAYNSILKEDTYSFNALLETIRAIKSGINKNCSEDYISNGMLLEEKFKEPEEIIKLFISINHYTP